MVKQELVWSSIVACYNTNEGRYEVDDISRTVLVGCRHREGRYLKSCLGRTYG